MLYGVCNEDSILSAALISIPSSSSGVTVFVIGAGESKFCHLHQQAWIELEIFKSTSVLHLSEVLYKVVDAELFEFGA